MLIDRHGPGNEEKASVDDTSDYKTLRPETLTVSIRRPADVVWDMASDVTRWPHFVRCVLSARLVAGGEYHLTSRQQGKVVLRTGFDRDRLILDHLVILPIRLAFFHACRLIPNHHGTELIVSSIQRPRESPVDFSSRVDRLRAALDDLRDVAEAGGVSNVRPG
ncbi:hypothetical protein [Micromonospora sp. NPDC126480]|uniref:hypothetical protein n=1 Tax=Micromonospora sp. NPDC126480 TaxID=3155312 RepID=UPI0033342637